MKEFNYLLEKNRMVSNISSRFGDRENGGCYDLNVCRLCPLGDEMRKDTETEDLNCTLLEIEEPEIATAIVRDWAEKHPEEQE